MRYFQFEAWPTEYHHIAQHFGANPLNIAQFGLPGHDGVDIEAPLGTKVFAVAPGEVYRVREKPDGHNYGTHVRVSHRDRYQTIYAHLSKVLVHPGQIIGAGAVLGLAGRSGNGFGNHLHLTLKHKGNQAISWPHNIVDPTPYLLSLVGWSKPAGPYVDGWVLSDTLISYKRLAQIVCGGATLYIDPARQKSIPEATIVILLARNQSFSHIKVPLAAIGLKDTKELRPAPEPPPIISTVGGWVLRRFLTTVKKQAIAGPFGVYARSEPDNSAPIIGLVKSDSTLSVVGEARGHFLPVRVRRNDFMEPVVLVNRPPELLESPPKGSHMGWVLTQYLSPLAADQALSSRLGVNLRDRPGADGQNIGLIKAYATVRVAGQLRGDYTPILVHKYDLLNIRVTNTDVELPDPVPLEEQSSTPQLIKTELLPGWAFSKSLASSGTKARAGPYGISLREAPRRNGNILGYIPPDARVFVTSRSTGEYTPIRTAPVHVESALSDKSSFILDDHLIGQARIGLHASVDLGISAREMEIFEQLRPGIIKILSFHSAADISRLAAAHPDAHWIVRAHLSFGGRDISPSQFLYDTIGDVRRAVGQLRNRSVVVELHHQPNVVAEGLGQSWIDGAGFGNWFKQLLKKYRQALPGTRFIYPGLSPGTTISGKKIDHVQFIEASRDAVQAADGLGIHVYWSDVYPLKSALNAIDDYISRFRSHPLWITEASRNMEEVNQVRVAQEYLRFWRELQIRPVVKGVTYFVASAADERLAKQAWTRTDLGLLMGRR